MAQKTFGQAFAEARKQGLDKFEWKGGWYTTKRADETNAQSRATGTVSNRKKVTKNGQTGYVVKEGKDGTLDAGKMGELEVVAPRLKVNRKTSGFQPVDENKNYNKANGDTRLYQERGTGRYLVTDNRDNIVGYSFDPAAATSDANWGGWIAYTGSKNDLKAAGAGKLRDEANRNEVNQKTKQAHDRITDDRERQMDGIRRMQGGFNTVQGMLNMPNNIITGAIRAGVSDDYSWDDYKDSFTIDGLWRGNSSVGLGDVLEINNGYGRFAANLINPMSLATLRGGLGKKTTKGEGYNSHAATHNADAHVVQNKVTGSSRPVNAERMNIHERMSPNGPSRITDNIWNNSREQVGSRLLELGEKPVWKPIQAGARNQKGDFSLVNPKNGQVTTTGPTSRTQSPDMIKATYERAPMTQTSIRTTPRTGTVKLTTPGIETTTYSPWMSGKPFNAAFRYDPKTTYKYSDETPTAEFYYGGEGKSNTYAQGRIATGEVVPGTSGKNWNGGQSGNKLDVINTKGHFSPSFGGVTVGNGSDNKSNWYLYGRHKNGGKLIPRKV